MDAADAAAAAIQAMRRQSAAKSSPERLVAQAIHLLGYSAAEYIPIDSTSKQTNVPAPEKHTDVWSGR
jgi:hypothetical protein